MQKYWGTGDVSFCFFLPFFIYISSVTFCYKGTIVAFFLFLQEMAENFVLVEFLKTNNVAVTLSSWLVSKDKSLRPPYHSSIWINNAVWNRFTKYRMDKVFCYNHLWIMYSIDTFFCCTRVLLYVIQRLQRIVVVTVPYIFTVT